MTNKEQVVSPVAKSSLGEADKIFQLGYAVLSVGTNAMDWDEMIHPSWADAEESLVTNQYWNFHRKGAEPVWRDGETTRSWTEKFKIVAIVACEEF